MHGVRMESSKLWLWCWAHVQNGVQRGSWASMWILRVVWGWMSPWRLWFLAHVHNGATKSQLGFLSESSRVAHWQSFFFVIMLNQTCRDYNFLQPQLCVPLFFFWLFASLTHHLMLWFPCGGKLWILICTTTTWENPYWLGNKRKSSTVSSITFTLKKNLTHCQEA